MEVIYPRCAGLDVHASSLTACLRIATGHEVTYHHRTVATTTAGLLELAARLEARDCTHVAMEATGVYWKPVLQVLEGPFALVLAPITCVEHVIRWSQWRRRRQYQARACHYRRRGHREPT